MSRLTHRFTRLTLSFALTALVALSAALPAFAANLTLTAKSYSHSAQNQTGTMVLTADDSTGSGAGWNVTIESLDFVYSGGSLNGSDIPAANFAITTANAPAYTASRRSALREAISR